MTRPRVRCYVAPLDGCMLLLPDIRATTLRDHVSYLWNAEHYPATQRVVRGGGK